MALSDSKLNTYAYCDNNPINKLDPGGHSGFFDTFFGQLFVGENWRLGLYTGTSATVHELSFHAYRNSVAEGMPGYGTATTFAAVGREAGLTALTLGGAQWIRAARAAAAAEQMAAVSRWGREGLEAGDWVMRGRATKFNYFLSGKWQPEWLFGGSKWANEYAPFGSGSSFQVLQSSIKWPSGWGLDGWIKGILNQRVYRP